MIIDMLHAFAVGIAFAVGVTVGAVLCQLATREGRKEFQKDLAEHKKEQAAHNNRVEDRLAKYAVNSERMAVALEAILATKQAKP